MRPSKLMLIALLIALLAWILPAQAAMTQEELIKYAYDASLALEGYQSYQMKTNASVFEERTLKANGQNISQSSTGVVTESLTTIIRDGNPRASYNASLTFSQGAQFYSLAGELRYVNNALYAKAAYINNTSSTIVYPPNWSLLADPYQAGVFGVLRPDALLDELGIPQYQQVNPLENADTFKNLVVNITLENSVNELNEPIEIIRITLDKRFFEALLGQSPWKNYLSAASQGRYILYLKNGAVYASETSFMLQFLNLDTAIDGSIPVGQTVDLTTFENRKSTLTAVNDPGLQVLPPQ
jgi:hypothetical protein